MFYEWAAFLSVHQLITIGKLFLLLWCLIELVNWSKEFLWAVVLSLVDLSSSINKWLDFSVLSLDDLSHSLVEEVLSGISSSSALGSRLVLSSHLSLAEWRLVSSWDLEASINWINLMMNDEVLAFFTNFLLLSWHS